jgi:predicted short-subunit dehydrogenase-like oxidoreductase (DUF2520 family)
MTMTDPVAPTAPSGSSLTVGVIGAGRVGAVLGAALRSAGWTVAAVAAESDASRHRAASLLPGVRTDKPTAVARSCDLLLLTVPDDMLENVVVQLAASGALREGQYVAHTSGRHGLAVLRAAREVGARPLALHPAMTFTGTELDLGRLPGCAFGVTTDADDTSALARRLVEDLDGRLVAVPEERRSLYHAGLAHGANHLVTLVTQAMEMVRESGAEDPAATLRPLLTAALDNALTLGDAALTGPIVRGDVETVRAHVEVMARTQPSALASYVALARATANTAVLDGRLLPIRAAKLVGVLNDALEKVSA